MKKRVIIIVSIVVVFVLIVMVGAAAVVLIIQRNTTADQTSSGETCGGIAGLRCPEGYVCYYPETADYPDAAGQCIPEYVDESRATNTTTPADWPVYTNDTYGFSVHYPPDWGATDYAPTETHFDALTGESIKYTVFDYSDAPATAADRDSPTFTKQEIAAKDVVITTQANTTDSNGTLVYLSVQYDQSTATFIRLAEFFIGEDYVRFTMPILDNILPDGGLAVDPNDQDQLDTMIANIEDGQADSTATKRVNTFDTMIMTLAVQ